MNFKINNLFSSFSKKLMLQLYFIFFILINLLDFLNFLSGDVDFFKKILSWILIGMIFYKASFSKIFVGTVDRFYDWMFIIGFSLMGVVKSIFHYIKISNLDEFFIFGWLLKLFPNSSEPFLTNSFILGVFIVIVSSIFLIRKHKPKTNSLIGSFKFKGYLKFIGAEYLTLSVTSLFFGLIVFNYIMEWFALAVDSIILVLGLVYYLFLFIHHHTDVRTDNLLSVVSNTGNDFYQNLIKNFSNKKTFLIGVSFILTLHLLVDIGVYLIPFLTGLTNSLYGNFVLESVPIFNFFDFSNSLFFNDLQTVFFEPISMISLLIVHISSILLLSLLLFLPFYYFYKNVQFEKVQLPNWVEISFLFSFLIQCLVYFMPNLTNPILIDWKINSQIIGVDLNASSVLLNGVAPIELILVLILSLIFLIESRYLLKSNINEFIRKKFISGIVLVFFIFYILVFGVSTVYNEFDKTFLKDRINSDFDEYNAVIELYSNKMSDRINQRIFFPQTLLSNYFDLKYVPISTVDYATSDNVEKVDFLIVEISNIKNPESMTILNHKNNALFDGSYNYLGQYFKSGEFTFIYKLGENGIEFSGDGRHMKISKLNVNFNEILQISEKYKLTYFVEILRLIILTIFYFGGLVVFVRHFFKSNILRN